MLKLTYYGHDVFLLDDGNLKVIIDPFLTGNSLAPVEASSIKVDYILVTHGHGDHVGDTLEIARHNQATVIAPFELATWLGTQGVEVHAMHIGGAHDFPFGRVKLTQALHGSAVVDGDRIIYTGNPVGFLVTMGNKRVYHAGDTGLFGDMRLLGETEKPQVALLPIGDNFTMGPDDALIAAEWLNPELTIPMHYNTFPVIEQDPRSFVRRLEEKGLRGRVMEFGETIEL